jgi:hypothetical protein
MDERTRLDNENWRLYHRLNELERERNVYQNKLTALTDINNLLKITVESLKKDLNKEIARSIEKDAEIEELRQMLHYMENTQPLITDEDIRDIEAQRFWNEESYFQNSAWPFE